MTLTFVHVAFGALFFAGAGYLGAQLGSAFAERLPRFDDGPAPHGVPIALLLIGCAAIGAFAVLRGLPQAQLLVFAIACLALVAVWITDAHCGIVPDVFTLGPLAVVLIAAFVQRDWWPFISVALLMIPFAVTALVSHGRGMGWGDVKLVALGAAILGTPGLAILTFVLACLAAAIISFMRGQRRGAIAFAPYLATAIGVALPLGMWR